MCLAIPGQIISINEGDALSRTGQVSFGGIVKDVSLMCVPAARVGQFVLVHAGLAINVVDETHAAEVFGYLDRMNELGELQEDPS